jgi:hypothetical protein
MLEIRVDGGRDAFAPGEPIRGTLGWTLEEAPRELTLKLIWYTEGRGDRDVGVARTLSIDAPAAIGNRSFDLAGPGGPYSCSGRLVSIRWALEAACEPGGHSARAELVIAPEGREVQIVPTAAGIPQ